MTTENLLGQMQTVFRQVFHDTAICITAHTTADDIALWDSLTHLELIAAIEKQFGLVFSFEQVMQFRNVGDMVNLVEKLQKKV